MQWVIGGEAPCDLWKVDIRRFGDFTANRRALAQRTAQTLRLWGRAASATAWDHWPNWPNRPNWPPR